MAKGVPLPDWYTKEQPQVASGDEFYLKAFYRLSTCRETGMGIGPIPWTAIVEYGKHVGFDRNMCDVLVVIIETMDDVFINWHNKEAEKRNKPARVGNQTVTK